MLDPHRRLFAHRLYRGACLRVPSPGDARLALLLKDLGRLGRDLSRTVLIDNTPVVRWNGTCRGRLCKRVEVSIMLCITQLEWLPTRSRWRLQSACRVTCADSPTPLSMTSCACCCCDRWALTVWQGSVWTTLGLS